jgi:hypothetical protein
MKSRDRTESYAQPCCGAGILTSQWVRRRGAVLEPTDVQECVFEVDLVPAKVHQFRRTQAVAVS